MDCKRNCLQVKIGAVHLQDQTLLLTNSTEFCKISSIHIAREKGAGTGSRDCFDSEPPENDISGALPIQTAVQDKGLKLDSTQSQQRPLLGRCLKKDI